MDACVLLELGAEGGDRGAGLLQPPGAQAHLRVAEAPQQAPVALGMGEALRVVRRRIAVSSKTKRTRAQSSWSRSSTSARRASLPMSPATASARPTCSSCPKSSISSSASGELADPGRGDPLPQVHRALRPPPRVDGQDLGAIAGEDAGGEDAAAGPQVVAVLAPAPLPVVSPLTPIVNPSFRCAGRAPRTVARPLPRETSRVAIGHRRRGSRSGRPPGSPIRRKDWHMPSRRCRTPSFRSDPGGLAGRGRHC